MKTEDRYTKKMKFEIEPKQEILQYIQYQIDDKKQKKLDEKVQKLVEERENIRQFKKRLLFDRQEKKDGIKIQTRWARSYAGMFQTNYELLSKKRPVMGMHGYGGQHVVIDFENLRIVVANSIHEDWDFKKIVYEPIRKGID